MNISFTYIPELDIEILDKLDDKSLTQVCNINKYVKNLCNSDYILSNRLKKYWFYYNPFRDHETGKLISNERFNELVEKYGYPLSGFFMG